MQRYVLICLFLFAGNCYAQLPDSIVNPFLVDSLFVDDDADYAGPIDTTKVDLRPFSTATVDSLKADPDLSYTQPPTIAESLWDRFLSWISRILEALFEKTTTTDLGRFLMYTGLLIAIIILIMMLLRVNALQVFYSGAETKPTYQVFHENIHEMNFDELIREATEKREYRLATRLVFLHALKLLSDKHLIDFTPGKTNHDYVEELNPGEVKTGLNELSFYFDYAWYGNFSISENQFQKIRHTFSYWREKI